MIKSNDKLRVIQLSYLSISFQSVERQTQSVLTGLRLESSNFSFTFEEFSDGGEPLQGVEIFPLIENG